MESIPILPGHQRSPGMATHSEHRSLQVFALSDDRVIKPEGWTIAG